MNTHKRTHPHTHMKRTNIPTQEHTHRHKETHPHTLTHMNTHKHACTHTHTHTHTNDHTHIIHKQAGRVPPKRPHHKNVSLVSTHSATGRAASAPRLAAGPTGAGAEPPHPPGELDPPPAAPSPLSPRPAALSEASRCSAPVCQPHLWLVHP